MPDITATVYPDEAYVLIQTDWSGTLLRDTFQRVATSTWQPAADTGQVWAIITGVGTDFPVNGTQGQNVHSVVGTTKRLRSPIAVLDSNATGVFYNPVVPTGGDFSLQVLSRFVDTSNFIEARFNFLAAGTVTVFLRQVIGGVITSSSTATIAGLPTSGVYGFRFLAQGSSLSARMWEQGTPEPTTWNVTFTTTWLTVGDFGIGTIVGAGVTNPTPLTFAMDNIVVVDPNAVTTDCAIVTRRNTVTGEVIQLRPYVFFDADGALILECGQGLWWDTEPPLNVPLEYCTFACDAPVTVTLNPSFESGVSSWSDSGGVLTQDCTIAKFGSCSGRFTPTGVDADGGISQTGFSLMPGLVTTVSGWIRSSQGWNGVNFGLTVTYSDATFEDVVMPIEILDDGEWRFLSATFVPRLPTTFAFLFLNISGIPANTNLFNIDEFKVTQLTEVTASDCVTVTVESDSVWLKNPLHPCLDVEVGLCSPMLNDCTEDDRVSYVGTFDDTFDANTVLLSPVNRRRPIPINRVRRDASATLRLLTHDCDAKDAVLAINEPGDPLLFQAPATYCIPDRYISVGFLGETRISVDQRDDFRLMTLPYVTVDRPEGPADGVCGARISDLCDIYTSWGALTIAGLTWTDLLLGLASPNGPGQPDPPAAARDWDEVEAEFVDWDDVEAGGTRDWDELRDGL